MFQHKRFNEVKSFNPAIRISLILVLFTLSILLAADSLFKFSEERINASLESRKAISETLVYQSSYLIHSGKEKTLAELINVSVENNPDVISIALFDESGHVSISTKEHNKLWIELSNNQSNMTQVQLPIYKGEEPWGTLQIRFKSGRLSEALHLLQEPFIKLTLFICSVGFLVYFLFIKKTLQYLDPSALIPGRVKTALDSLAEGVIFIDMEERIVLSNSNFEKTINKSITELMGKKISELNWKVPETKKTNYRFPWHETLEQGKNKLQSHLKLTQDSGEEISFNVNSSPIYGEKEKICGAIVSFSDVTELEQTNRRLISTVEKLDDAHQEVLRQNEELEKLATRDPMTGCLNRRAFFELLSAKFSSAKEHGNALCCIMADIDYFKKINDTYGHAIGDAVIISFAKIINKSLRTQDVICRYGGEEFCILLIDIEIEKAVKIAERMRRMVKFDTGSSIREPSGISVTSSFGISCASSATEPKEMISQADKALYQSKKSGRNLVSCFQNDETTDAHFL